MLPLMPTLPLMPLPLLLMRYAVDYAAAAIAIRLCDC